MQNAWLDETQAGIKIAERNINNLGYADDLTLIVESEEAGTEEPLDGSDRGEWKSRLKTQLSKKKSVLNTHWKDWCWRWNS